MRIYARKLFPHDITHEVSVKTEIVKDFFDGNTTGLTFSGRHSNFKGEVSINSATDPRFGGAFSKVVSSEGKAELNDILLMYKIDSTNYVLELIKPNDERFFGLMILFRGSARHGFLETENKYNPIES